MEDVPYGRIVREGWAIMVMASLFGLIAAFGVAKILPHTYTASTTMMLLTTSSQATKYESSQFSTARIKTYPTLVDSPAVIDGVRADLKLSTDEFTDRDIRRMISAENTPDTVLMVISAEASTANQAAEIANAAAKHMTTMVEELENAGEDAKRYDIKFTQMLPALPPVKATSPQTMAIVGLGGILGLAAGIIFAVYRTTTRRSIVTVGDVRRTAGLPVIGMLPRSHAARGRASEAFIGNLIALGGTARTSFTLIADEHELRDTATLTSLIEAGAAVGRDIVVLDLRAHAHHDGAGTLVDALTRGAEKTATIYHAVHNVDPGLTERAAPALVTALSRHHDMVFVVVDSRSVGLLASLHRVGATLVPVIRRGHMRSSELASFTSRLRVMGIRPLGVVLTNAGRGQADSIARTWRAADSAEFVRPEMTSADLDRARIVAEIAAAERVAPLHGPDPVVADLGTAEPAVAPLDSDVEDSAPPAAGIGEYDDDDDDVTSTAADVRAKMVAAARREASATPPPSAPGSAVELRRASSPQS